MYVENGVFEVEAIVQKMNINMNRDLSNKVQQQNADNGLQHEQNFVGITITELP